MSKKLIKAAEEIKKSMISKIGYYDDNPEDRIEIISNDDGVFVAWESGPFEWTRNDGHTLSEELGMAVSEQYALEPYYSVPKGFEAEPENGIMLAVYSA